MRIIKRTAGIVVCHPKVLTSREFGPQFFRTRSKFLVPIALNKVLVEKNATRLFSDDARRTEDAIVLKLAHLRLNFTFQFVDGAQSAVELGELVVAARVIGTSEIVPLGVVVQFQAGEEGGCAIAATTLIQRRAGKRGEEVVHAELEFDGNQTYVMETFSWLL